MFITRKRDRRNEKEQDSRRKKTLRTKYGQKHLKHAKKGIQSCVIAAIVIMLLIFMLVSSFVAKGKISVVIGVLGLMTLIFAGVGLDLGLRGFKEREKNYITCRAGAICNGVVLLGMAAIFIRGLI